MASFNKTEPATDAAAITPHDTNEITNPPRAIYIGTGGNIKVDMTGAGTGITFVNVQTGSILPIRVSLVYATGTTATDLVGIH